MTCHRQTPPSVLASPLEQVWVQPCSARQARRFGSGLAQELEQRLAQAGRVSAANERMRGMLRDLGLPDGDWAVFGSGPLLMRGWIDDAGDIDIITRGSAWERARQLGNEVHLEDGSIIIDAGDGVTLGSRWLFGDPDIDELIDTVEIVADVPCVRIEHVERYKRLAGRPKDRVHLAIIEAHR